MKRRNFIAKGAVAAAYAMGLASCTSTTQAPVVSLQKKFSLKFVRDFGNRLIVQALASDGAPLDMILDTAATRTAFFQNYSRQYQPKPIIGVRTRVYGLSGSFFASLYDIDEYQIGTEKLSNFTAPVIPDWEYQTRTPHGIIGLDFLSQFRIVIDPVNQQIDFYDPPALARDEGNGIPFRKLDLPIGERPLYYLEIDFSFGRKIPFLVDTGSTFTACNFPAARFLEVRPRRAYQTPSETAYDVHGKAVETFAITSSIQRLGGRDFSVGEILISNAAFFSEIGYSEVPFGILGLNSLLLSRLTLEFARERAFFK